MITCNYSRVTKIRWCWINRENLYEISLKLKIYLRHTESQSQHLNLHWFLYGIKHVLFIIWKAHMVEKFCKKIQKFCNTKLAIISCNRETVYPQHIAIYPLTGHYTTQCFYYSFYIIYYYFIAYTTWSMNVNLWSKREKKRENAFATYNCIQFLYVYLYFT